MYQKKSIFEDSEQTFSRPIDNEYARFDVGSVKKGDRYSDEFDYNYSKDNIYQVSKSSRQNSRQTTPIIMNIKSNEVQPTDIDLEEGSQLNQNKKQQDQNQHNEQRAQPNSKTAHGNQQEYKQQPRNTQLKNYLASIKQKGVQENSEQMMQYPAVNAVNTKHQFMKSINISPIQNASFQKSVNQSEFDEEEEEEKDECASEISQIQKYINNNLTQQNSNCIPEPSQNKVIPDNLDFAEMIIKKKQPSPPPQQQQTQPNSTTEEQTIKKVLVSQFDDEKSESVQDQNNNDNIEKVEERENVEVKREQPLGKQQALQKAKDVNLSNYIPYQTIRLSLDNQKKILFQGEIYKYKPGVNYNFISRYICLSLETIKYYKDRVHSRCYEDKPLYELPLSCISSVQQVSFTVPLLPKELQRQKKNMQKLNPDNVSKNVKVYYFEIIIESGNTKQGVAENEITVGNKLHSHLMPQDNFDSYRNGELNKQIRNLTTWSGRSHEWYESEERLLLCTHDKNVLDTWVAVLNWIISLHRQNQKSSSSSSKPSSNGRLSE